MSRLETWYSWYLQSADIYTGCQPPPSSHNIPHTISRLCDPLSVRNMSASWVSRRKTNKSAVAEPFYAQYEMFQNNLSLKTQHSTYYDERGIKGAPLPPASPCDRCLYLLTCLVSSPRLVFWTMCEGLLATVYMPHRRRQQPSSDWAALLPTTHQTLHHGATQCCSAECDVLCTKYYTDTFYLVL